MLAIVCTIVGVLCFLFLWAIFYAGGADDEKSEELHRRQKAAKEHISEHYMPKFITGDHPNPELVRNHIRTCKRCRTDFEEERRKYEKWKLMGCPRE